MARSRRLGICAFDDSVGAIALAAARVLDLTAPAALAVIGVDDAPFSPFLAPPLTTLAIDGRSTGLALAERFLNDDESRDRSHAAARLVRRASV
jgi:DNA-binding LacI/PurR family transcriptional regulator